MLLIHMVFIISLLITQIPFGMIGCDEQDYKVFNKLRHGEPGSAMMKLRKQPKVIPGAELKICLHYILGKNM